MESLGEVGRIQVEEKTAKLLMESLCVECESHKSLTFREFFSLFYWHSHYNNIRPHPQLNHNWNKTAYSIVLRGPIDVKGKGGMVTYFVDKKRSLSSDDAIHNQQGNQQQQQAFKGSARERFLSSDGQQQQQQLTAANKLAGNKSASISTS